VSPSSDWPGLGRRRPPISTPTYHLLHPLSRWLEEEARSAHARHGRYKLLDVGCGVKPYSPLFEPFVSEYVGVDPNPEAGADLVGEVEALPVDDGRFDVVICTQVLEHCDDPAQAVRELRRVTAPGGRVLASTHGVQVYHPAPHDYWRWTHTGLERLFRENGDWQAVTVRPASGTTACLGLLLATYIDLLSRHAHVAPAGRAVVAALNRLTPAIDRRSARLREPGPGSLHANYHVTAEVASK
jgi:SAM-dependent methyltransferase